MSGGARSLERVAQHMLAANIEHKLDDDALIADCPACNAKGGLTAVINQYHQAQYACRAGCTETAIAQALKARRDPTRPFTPYAVTWEGTGKSRKLVLPDEPAEEDLAGLLSWITSVLGLNRSHPVTSVRHLGLRGAEGSIELRRMNAPALLYEPAGAICSATRFKAMHAFQHHVGDAKLHGFKDEHCAQIAYVLAVAYGTCEAPGAEQEAAAIISAFMDTAEMVEGHTTYGTVVQRYEAVLAARPDPRNDHYRKNYLIDLNTGEIVIRVSDLREAARSYLGGSLRHGWLDARMDGLGWTRKTVHGFAQAGKVGKTGKHRASDFYRGHLPAPTETTED